MRGRARRVKGCHQATVWQRPGGLAEEAGRGHAAQVQQLHVDRPTQGIWPPAGSPFPALLSRCEVMPPNNDQSPESTVAQCLAHGRGITASPALPPFTLATPFSSPLPFTGEETEVRRG